MQSAAPTNTQYHPFPQSASATDTQYCPYPSMPYPMAYGLPYSYSGVQQPPMMYNHMGHPMPPMLMPYGVPQTMVSAQTPAVPKATVPTNSGGHEMDHLAAEAALPSSPASSEDDSSLTDYFRFAKVDPNDADVNKVVNDLGITHYSSFSKFKFTELEARGIRPAPSRLLTSCVGKFKRHLKRKKENSRPT
jgi:hypothetical protein